MKKNKLKRFLTVALVAAMTCTMAMPALAAEMTETETAAQDREEGTTEDPVMTPTEESQTVQTDSDETVTVDSVTTQADFTESETDSEDFIQSNTVITQTYEAPCLEEVATDYAYYVNNVRQYTTGIIKVNGIWYYVKNGVVTGDTVAKNANGWWYINPQGKVDFSFTGIAQNANGWWYCKKGKVQFNVNDVLKTKTCYGNSGWYNIRGGKLVANTVAKNGNGWWYINKNGMVDFSFTGIASNSKGTWYCEKGKVNFNKTGTITTSSNFYYIHNSKVETSMNRGSGWRSAYCTYLRNLMASDSSYKESGARCSLAFIDNDNIPELIVQAPYHGHGGEIITYHSGSGLQKYFISYNGWNPSYLYRGSKVYYRDYWSGGNYEDHVATYSGKWTEVFAGDILQTSSGFKYCISNAYVSSSTYSSRLKAAFNFNDAATTNCWITPTRMVSYLGY